MRERYPFLTGRLLSSYNRPVLAESNSEQFP